MWWPMLRREIHKRLVLSTLGFNKYITAKIKANALLRNIFTLSK